MTLPTRLMHIDDWMHWRLPYRLQPAWEWLARILFCHYNACVLADMEYRFGCVLCHTTNTMSKPYYDLDSIYAEIDDAFARSNEEALHDFITDLPEQKSYTLQELCESAGVAYGPVIFQRGMRIAQKMKRPKPREIDGGNS